MGKPAAGSGTASGGTGARMFGDEGQRVLREQGPRLFPVTIRPGFLRLLWTVLGLLAVAAAVVLAEAARVLA